MKYKIVSLDFDGTLIHPKIYTEDIYYSIMKDYTDNISNTEIRRKFQLFENEYLNDQNELKIRFRNFGKFSVEERKKLFYEWNAERVKYILPTVSADESLEILDKIMNLMKKNPEMELFPEVKESLLFLQEQGIQTYILSGNNKQYITKFLKSKNIQSFFVDVLTPDSLDTVKKELFKYYLTKVKGSELVHVGDDPQFDYFAPKNLGLQAFWLKRENGRYYDSSIPKNETLTSLTELKGFL